MIQRFVLFLILIKGRPPVCFRAGYSWFRYTERLNGPRAGRFFEKGIRISREPLGRHSPSRVPQRRLAKLGSL